MWNIEPYHDILNEYTRGRHTIGSGLIVLLIIGVLIFVFA